MAPRSLNPSRVAAHQVRGVSQWELLVDHLAPGLLAQGLVNPADPDATLSADSSTRHMRAVEAHGALRDSAGREGLTIHPGWAAYQQRGQHHLAPGAVTVTSWTPALLGADGLEELL